MDFVDLFDIALDAFFVWPGPAPRTGIAFPDDFQDPPVVAKAFSGSMPGWSIRPLRGTPVAQGSILETAEPGILGAGQWQLTPGGLYARCNARTQFQLLQGQLTLTGEHGDAFTPLPEARFFVEAGTAATWDIQAPVLLNFVLAEP